jgi:uncharacterized protein YifN (PemK superfamily)
MNFINEEFIEIIFSVYIFNNKTINYNSDIENQIIKLMKVYVERNDINDNIIIINKLSSFNNYKNDNVEEVEFFTLKLLSDTLLYIIKNKLLEYYSKYPY